MSVARAARTPGILLAAIEMPMPVPQTTRPNAPPPEATTGDTYRGVIPFIAVQLIGLALLMAFPQISLWLPTAIGWIK